MVEHACLLDAIQFLLCSQLSRTAAAGPEMPAHIHGVWQYSDLFVGNDHGPQCKRGS